MKLKALVITLVSTLLVAVSCSSTTSITNSKDFLNGSTAGTVLNQLNKQFQTAGSIDLGNVQNILSLSTLASTLTSLTNGSLVSTNDYTSGLISAASQLVGKENASKVIGGLTELAGLNLAGVTGSLQKGSAVDASKLESIQSAIDGVFSLFKK